MLKNEKNREKKLIIVLHKLSICDGWFEKNFLNCAKQILAKEDYATKQN